MKSRPSSPSGAAGLRLNKYLASCGLGARRKCEDFITEGRVTVNGEIAQSLGVRVRPGDDIRVDGRSVRPAEEVTLVIYKPKGYLCSRSGLTKQRLVYELLPEEFKTLNYVGRLDLETKGLLLFTNSGALHQTLTHPSHSVEKEYEVRLDRDFDPKLIHRLIKGVHLAEGLARAVVVRQHPKAPACLTMVLAQGYNRQVRRMFAALGYKVRELERVRIGNLQGLGLAQGQYKVLGKSDLAKVTQVSDRATAPTREEGPAQRRARPAPGRSASGGGSARGPARREESGYRKTGADSRNSGTDSRGGSSRRPPRKRT